MCGKLSKWGDNEQSPNWSFLKPRGKKGFEERLPCDQSLLARVGRERKVVSVPQAQEIRPVKT